MEYILYVVATILILPGLIYGVYAQINVSKTFNAFSTMENKSGKTGAEIARIMLDNAGLNEVKIQGINGKLTDNYNPKTKTLSLSESTFASSSVAAIGVAAHEVGHAIQHKESYKPLKIRSALVPIVNIASTMFWPLFVVGIVLMFVSKVCAPAGEIIVWVSVAFYGSSTLFYLITLPVEFDASKRAINILSNGLLEQDEVPYARKVLKAAAQTYISALVTSAIYFLRFFFYVLMILGNGKSSKK